MKTTCPSTTSINVSRHATQRARERLGWSGRVLQRMVSRVLGFGIASDDVAGTVHRYMEEKEATAGSFVRSYGENLFVFQAGPALGELTLITVWPLPGEMRGLLRRARNRA